MFESIYNNLIYFLKLNANPEILWTTIPLAIATIVTLLYFEKYYDENPGWNTYVANSLVLVFLSAILFKYIFSINNAGAINLIEFPLKAIISWLTFIIGATILLLDFEHFLPEKIAKNISSPLTLNLVGYTLLLFVYSELDNIWTVLVSLLIIFFILLTILNLIRIPIKKLFLHLKKMKENEKIENFCNAKCQLKKTKKEIERQEKKLKKTEIKKIKNQKKEIKKFRKIIDSI